MPRRATKELTAKFVAKAPAGRYGDRGATGLYLLVREARAPGRKGELDRFWLYRYVRNGRMREMGLGPASGPDAVPLGDQTRTDPDDGKETVIKGARTRAAKLRATLRDGADPLAEREASRAAAKAEAVKAAVAAITFRDVAGKYLSAHEKGWRNAKHAAQWSSTLTTYAFPRLGDMPVAEIDTGHVTAILERLWGDKRETASRLRGRVESILNYAKAMGWREGENPARWRGHLDHILARRTKAQEVEHHPALPWKQIGAFLPELREQKGVAALALRFAILTAARSGEVRGATWAEIDLGEATWTVPGGRMKAGREHRVPLSESALAVLREVASLRDPQAGGAALVFPGVRSGKPLSDMSLTAVLRRMKRDDMTVHGFRSTFRDWCAEATAYPRELAEAALAHTLRDKVEAAYQRGDMFDKRRRLMDEWATFCARPVAEGHVLPLRKLEVA
jgi:integrase